MAASLRDACLRIRKQHRGRFLSSCVVTRTSPSSVKGERPRADATTVEPSWAWEVLEAPEHLDGLYADDAELLPDDYLFIATVILGGDV